MPGRRSLALLNALVTVVVVAWNYWTAAFGLNGQKVGEMSSRYDTLFTPAGYAFSIWGLIFLLLMAHAGYQLWLAFRAPASASDKRLDEHRSSLFERLGPLLIFTNVANGLWIVLWLTEQTGASVLVLAAMCVFMALAIRRLDMNLGSAPLEVRLFVRAPLGIYAGWVTVAVLANLSAYLSKEGIVPGDSAAWAILMIAVAAAYNVVAVLRRGLRVHAMVAVWAFLAIAVARWGETPTVQWVALAAALAVGVLVLAHTSGAFEKRRRREPLSPTAV